MSVLQCTSPRAFRLFSEPRDQATAYMAEKWLESTLGEPLYYAFTTRLFRMEGIIRDDLTGVSMLITEGALDVSTDGSWELGDSLTVVKRIKERVLQSLPSVRS
jgi:hypothetical protein